MGGSAAGWRPRLRVGVRLAVDPVRSTSVLLYPEGVLVLNETAAAVLARCDGATSIADIAADLAAVYHAVSAEEVVGLLARLAGRRLVDVGEPVEVRPARPPTDQDEAAALGRPIGLLAELTYRCPLGCPYCSNPVNLRNYRDELDLEQWCQVLEQARDLGVWQLHLSGGEPLVHRDLVELVGRASRLGMYTNLVTSGVPLTARMAAALAGAGLDHVQLSVQDADAAGSDAIAGLVCFERKLAAATAVTALGLPLTLNVVLHRGNIDRIEEIINLGVRIGADRLELANAQYYGWALRNRAALLPTREQLDAAELVVRAARNRLADRLELVYVVADYHEGYPKPCMHGWGRRQLTVAPNGDVLPCPAAGQIPDLGVDNVRDRPLADIWAGSAAFTRFRGTDWLPEPCHNCPRKDIDYGGCRCQAYQLTGDPAVTDPACQFSPHHHLVTAATTRATATVAVPTAVPRRIPR